MAPKKTKARSMVEEPPDILVPEKTIREPKPKKRVAAPRVPRVKKPKARLKLVHTVKVKIPGPKGNETQEPSIEDEKVQERKEKLTLLKKMIKPKEKPPSYPKKLKKEDALNLANEVALAQLVKKSMEPGVTNTNLKNKLIRKLEQKQKPVPSTPCPTETGQEIKKKLAVEPRDKAPKAARKWNKKCKPKLQTPPQTTTEAPTDVSSATFTEVASPPKAGKKRTRNSKKISKELVTEDGHDEVAVEAVTSPPKAVKKKTGKTNTRVSKELKTEDPVLNGNIPKVTRKRAYKKKVPEPKSVAEHAGENNTTLKVASSSPVIKTMPVSVKRPRGRPKLFKSAESMDTSGDAIVGSMTISVKNRGARPKGRQNAALNKRKDPKSTNLVEAEPVDSVKIVKDLTEALIIKTDDKKVTDNNTKTGTTSGSSTPSWARDVSSSSAGTTPSSSSFELVNRKRLSVSVIDCKRELLQLGGKHPQLLASSVKTNAVSNETVKKPLKRSAPKRLNITKEDSFQESDMSPPNKKTKLPVNEMLKSQQIPKLTSTGNNADTQRSPRKSDRLNYQITKSPLKKTEEPPPKKILKSSSRSKTEVSDISENTKSGSRTSLTSDLTSETNKQSGKYSESSSSNVTSSMSIPMSAISEITRTGGTDIKECLNLCGEFINEINLEFMDKTQGLLRAKLAQIPQNIFQIEINYLSKLNNKQWTPFPNKAQSEKDSEKSYNTIKSINCTTSEPKENKPTEDHTNFQSAIENCMNSPNAAENNILFDAVDDGINFSNAVEDRINLPNAVEDCLNSPNAKDGNNTLVGNFPNAVEEAFENNQELDSFSDIVRQKSYEQRSNMEDDDDDLLSLFADSITGIESSKGYAPSVVCPFDAENNLKTTKETFTIPKLSKLSEETPPIPIQAKKQIVIQNKTKIICEKQNADSTSINKEEQNKKKTLMGPPIVSNKEPYQSSPIRFSPSSPPRLFNGVCFAFLIGICKKYENCHYPHRKLPAIEIEKRLNIMTDVEIKVAYFIVKQNPTLRNLYMLSFAKVCINRNMDFVLQIALDSLKEMPEAKLEFLETTLLYLNEKPMDVVVKLLMSKPNAFQLCDAFMWALAETANVKRFKNVFEILPQLMTVHNRKFDVLVAAQLLLRIPLVFSEENVLKALIQIIESTECSLFGTVQMHKFEEKLYNQSRTLYEELQNVKQNNLKHTRIPFEPSRTEFHEDNLNINTESFIQGDNNGLQIKANIEKQRYTSPDTTHLDNSQNKAVPETPEIPVVIDSRSRPFILPPPSSGPSQNFNNFMTAPPPIGNSFQRPHYRRNHNNGWGRGRPRMPRYQLNTVRPIYRPMQPPPAPFKPRGGQGFQRNPWQNPFGP